jgi:hypothetical protein
VLYCNYLIYYEPSKVRGVYLYLGTFCCALVEQFDRLLVQVGQPLDSAKPLGAHRLEDCKPDELKKFEKEIISGGLIPKMVTHDNCFSVPFGGACLLPSYRRIG